MGVMKVKFDDPNQGMKGEGIINWFLNIKL